VAAPGPLSTRMVADVGGTNTRMALFDPATGEFRALANYTNRDYLRFEDVIAHWLESLGEPLPQNCCIAVAAPPSQDHVVMVNMDWAFYCSELASQFSFAQFRRLNDFESNAYALPHLTDKDRKLLHSGSGARSADRLATVGPGTGLGGAVLDRSGGRSISYAAEPGHMSLAAGTELELALVGLLLSRHEDIYAELLVSGPGLLRLYQALGELRGEPIHDLKPADISTRALDGTDPLCTMALDTFCALLGSVCGDFLLANGAYGGLYLAGGIVPRMVSYLRDSEFHRRLITKGAMREHLNTVPVYVITAGHPGLLGAAHAPL
jgi:glucokinase